MDGGLRLSKKPSTGIGRAKPAIALRPPSAAYTPKKYYPYSAPPAGAEARASKYRCSARPQSIRENQAST